MDSSSRKERDELSNPPSAENGGQTRSKRLQQSIELNVASASSSGDSQPCDLDGYCRDIDSSTKLEMDLFIKSQNSAATSSYSLSEKYWEDYFQAMLSEGPNTQEDVLVRYENSDTGRSFTSSSSMEQASIVSDVTQASLIRTASPEQSPPPLQGMVRSGVYDPKRIPASVFERTKCQAPTPVEWSITSTESLFSIHLGNINFLKEKLRPLVRDPQNPEELDKGAITIRLPMQDKKASNSPISRQERSCQEQNIEASDGPISRLERSSHEQNKEASDGPISPPERNSHENENTAGVVNAVKLEQGNEYGIIEEKTGEMIVTYMPSLNNSRHDQSSSLSPKKNRSCLCFCPKPGFPRMRTSYCCSPACCCWGWPCFPWMRTSCCCRPACCCQGWPSFPWRRTSCCCSAACCCWGWPSCHWKCPSLKWNCGCPICSCRWITSCFRWPSCGRGCYHCFSCCNINCCTCGCYTISFSWKSCCYYCYSCRKCKHCC